jgi:DedD protein
VTSQLKQRVVGVCVLIFLALILLPWLFGSHQPAVFEQKNKKINIDAEPAIMIQPPSQGTRPIPNHVVQSVTPAVIPTKVNPPEVTATTKLTPPITDAEKISKIENSIVSSEPKPNIVVAKQPEVATPSFAKVLQEPNFTIQNHVAKRDLKKPVLQLPKRWAVQLGSFSNPENAERLLKQIKAKGYPVYLKASKNTEGKTITRVFIGPGEQQKLQGIISKIEKTFKIHGVVVKANA